MGYVDADADGYAACADCDDENSAVNDDGVEACDGIDNDCDGTVDEATSVDAVAWYTDSDGDGYGDGAVSTTACTAPTGYGADATDCDDTDSAYNPGATDVCTDPNDYNCDGSVGYADADEDGYAACADCDDDNAAVNDDGVEACDGIDNDCDGTVDEASATGTTAWYSDGDSDGYGDVSVVTNTCSAPAGYVSDATDCDDDDSDYNPGAAEVCTDPNDYNCDGSVGYANDDGDAYAACEDCDDTDPAVYPGAIESCDGVDDDCDGSVDEATAIDAGTWYADADTDGYGDSAMSTIACDAPTGYVSGSTDCDDGSGTVHPGATEYCNGYDDNCDGASDEASAADAQTWYADDDTDGYGDAGVALTSCNAASGYVSDATDCDDGAAAANPAATEVCEDDLDNDCSGDATDCELSGTSVVTTAPVHTYQGSVASDFVGSSMAMPDFDGDGTDDVFVGSYGYDISVTNQNDGRVYGYFGSVGSGTTTVSTSADVYFTGISASDVFGYSMAELHDYDGDGDDELLVGAYLRGSTDAGSAYLFRGSSAPTSGTAATAYGTFTSTSASDYGGYSIADAGDFDDDGAHDVLVSAYKRDSGVLSDVGVAAVFYATNTTGSKGIPTNYDVLLTGGSSSGYLGFALDGVGDVDGDGIDDVVVGAHGENTSAGSAYLLLGGVTGAVDTTDADGLVAGTSSFDQLGHGVTGLGDVDGDGLMDWAVAADLANDSTTDAGSVYFFSGSIVGTVAASAADAIITGESASDFAGRTLDGPGDVNGDGTPDLLIGATGNDGNASGAGAAYLFYGPFVNTSVTAADAIWQGSASNDAIGYGLGGGGDVNSDGYTDLLISAVAYDASAQSNSGAAWLYFGSGM